MKQIKILMGLALVVAAALVFAPAARAQAYSTTATTHSIAASTTSNLTTQSQITLTKYEDVAIYVYTKLAGSGTDATVLSYSKSVDGTNWETTPSIVITNTNTGTTPVRTVTNINMGAAGYLRLSSIINNDGGDVLTVTNVFARKPVRYGGK